MDRKIHGVEDHSIISHDQINSTWTVQFYIFDPKKKYN